MPYGPAIADAAARGDLQEMEAVAQAARHALAAGASGEQGTPAGAASAVQYHPVPPDKAPEVRKALEELERKIAGLRPPTA